MGTVPKGLIEAHVGECLPEGHRENALGFIQYVRESGMSLERLGGYWENKPYWAVKYSGEFACFILAGAEDGDGSAWTVWSDDSGGDCYADVDLGPELKEHAWKNVDFCAHCGSCGEARARTVFGKEFVNVCRTVFRFKDPDGETLRFMKEMLRIRKADISGKLAPVEAEG